jgi:hypothetical protein
VKAFPILIDEFTGPDGLRTVVLLMELRLGIQITPTSKRKRASSLWPRPGMHPAQREASMHTTMSPSGPRARPSFDELYASIRALPEWWMPAGAV